MQFCNNKKRELAECLYCSPQCFILSRYHGHHCVVKGAQRMRPLIHQSGKTAEELYQATLRREQQLKGLGYKVISIFECQFRRELEANEEMKSFVNNITIPGRLDPRDAFSGI